MTTALPNLVEYFGVSTSIGQWVTSGYSLAMGMVLPLTAFLIRRRFPTKKLYLSGIACFILGLLLSIFTTNFGVMMTGRILQACGNGVLMSAAQVVILTIYPVEKRGTMMGTYGLCTTAAPIVAPTIAGLLIDAFGWKSIFYVVLVIMAASLLLSCFVFEDVLELQDKKFDVISFVESIVAFGGITLGIGNISSFGLVSLEAGAPLVRNHHLLVFCFQAKQSGKTVPRCEDSQKPELCGERDRQHGSLSCDDGILGDDAAVCTERHGILRSDLGSCNSAGFLCHGGR